MFILKKLVYNEYNQLRSDLPNQFKEDGYLLNIRKLLHSLGIRLLMVTGFMA